MARLDQIVQRFGTRHRGRGDGRSRRIIRSEGMMGVHRWLSRAVLAPPTLAKTQAFMDDAKRILIFPDAGAPAVPITPNCRRKNRGCACLAWLEADGRPMLPSRDWAGQIVPNQAQPPLFRPIPTDVKPRNAFSAPIARRLDTLGRHHTRPAPDGGRACSAPRTILKVSTPGCLAPAHVLLAPWFGYLDSSLTVFGASRSPVIPAPPGISPW